MQEEREEIEEVKRDEQLLLPDTLDYSRYVNSAMRASHTHDPQTYGRGGAGVAQRLGFGLPRYNPGINSRWGWCKNQSSRPSQGTVNGVAVS